MKYYLPILVSLIAANHAFAKDFRTLDFGESCNKLSQLETDLGSHPKDSGARFNYLFQNVHFDRAAQITYLCDIENRFKKGLYIFNFNSNTSALEFYHLAKPQLILRYGNPVNEIVNDEVLGSVAAWKNNGISITLSKPIGHESESNAYVGISYRAQ